MAGAFDGERVPGRPATLIDIARVAGVSVSTASNALRGRGRMSAQTKDRVLQAADELGYAVNLSARNLRTARAGAIGVHLPDNKSRLAYYMDFCFGVADAADASDTVVVLIPRHAAISALKGQVDGFVLVDPPTDDPIAKEILETGMPVVSGDGAPRELRQPTASVESDHAAMITSVLDHLDAAGARRPALLSAGRTTQWSRQVEAGYESWAALHGLVPRIVETPDHADADAVGLATKELLLASDPPDAIVAVPSETAVRVGAVAHQLGRTVGEDLLLAAYADTPSLSLSVPAITAVELHPRELGRRCGETLLALLDPSRAESVPAVDMFPIDLVPRASTQGAAGGVDTAG